MSIRVTCDCGKSFDAPDAFAGRRGTCKACGMRIVIPSASMNEAFALQPKKKMVSGLALPLILIVAVLSVLGLAASRFTNIGVKAESLRGKGIAPTDTEEQERFHAMEGYLSAKKWEDRLPFVRNPKIVAPLMAKMYVGFPGIPTFNINLPGGPGISRMFPSMKLFVYSVEIGAQGGRPAYTTNYLLIKTKSGWKIEWEASVPSNPISIREFVADNIREPCKFRVGVRFIHYYNYQYHDMRDTHYSFEITDDLGNRMTAYASRKSEVGAKLSRLCKSGEMISLLLVIRHSRESDFSIPPRELDPELGDILDVVSDTWIDPSPGDLGL